MRKTMAERFWAKVDKTDGCWLWTGACDWTGYGRFGKRAAHAVARELATGTPIPAGMLVLHHCDVRHCVNPDHTYVGTHGDNSHDMDRRRRRPTSQTIGAQPITVGDVRRSVTVGQAAGMLGISVSSIKKLIRIGTIQAIKSRAGHLVLRESVTAYGRKRRRHTKQEG